MNGVDFWTISYVEVDVVWFWGIFLYPASFDYQLFTCLSRDLIIINLKLYRDFMINEGSNDFGLEFRIQFLN